MFSLLYKEPLKLDFDVKVLSDRITGKNRGKRVCLVSDTRAKMAPTAHQTAKWLAADGWKVTLLDLSPIPVSPLPPDATYTYVSLKGIFEETYWYGPMQSLCSYHWLKDKDFNLIVFQHGFGAGYFTATARKTFLAFANTPVVIIPDDPYAFWLESAERTVTSVRTEAEIDFLEKEAIKRADGILFTNKKALDWMLAAHWDLGKDPERLALLGHDEGMEWGQWMAAKAKNPPPKPALDASEISISVCISSYNRPEHLRKTLQDLFKQTYKGFQVVVVNTTDPGVEDPAEEFKSIFKEKNWTWLKQPKLGMSTACNYAASHATGTHILFKDDDNISLPDELEIFAKAAQSGADFVMCVSGKHYLSDHSVFTIAKFPARPGTGVQHQTVDWLHFGPVLSNGMSFNTFGDTNSLIKREVFKALNLFDIGKPDSPDWSGYARTALEGYRFESIPEALYLYRYHSEGWAQDQRFKKLIGGAMRFSYAAHLPAFMYPYILDLLPIDQKSKTNPGRFPDPIQLSSVTDKIGTHRTFKAVEDSSIPEVVTAVTDEYLRQCCAMIASLVTSTKGPIKINVISGMTSDNNRKLTAVVESFGAHANIIPYHSAKDSRLPPSVGLKNTPEALYWHFLFPEYLPNAKRVIVLKYDVLVREDIYKLWHTPLNNAIVGAVIDRKLMNRHTLRKTFKNDFFHWGVMSIDLDQWRKEDITEKSLAIARTTENNKDLEFLWGQAALNRAVTDHWTKISPTWNWYDDLGNTRAPLNGLDQGIYQIDERECLNIMANPFICHFEDLPGPWMWPMAIKSNHGNEFNLYLKLVDNALAAFSARQNKAA